MKRTHRARLVTLGAFAVAFAVGAVAGAASDPSNQVFWQETQASSRAIPNSVTQGFNLTGVNSYHLIVACSDSSNVTDGGETAWTYDLKLAQWVPMPTYANCTLPSGTLLADAGYTPSMCPEFVVTNPFGRILYQSDGVTCSGAAWDGGLLVQATEAQR